MLMEGEEEEDEAFVVRPWRKAGMQYEYKTLGKLTREMNGYVQKGDGMRGIISCSSK